ncbi:MAG: oxygen-independent coproporphyrinogen-3 oxidase [Saprospiraceae bacterium]|jgi:oxygen-independent coproporphyrinogen-3 oxidase
MVDAICREIELRKEYLTEKNLTSIYFGGGTPSLLTEENLDQIFSSLSKQFNWSTDTEITLEANPDDLSFEKLTVFNNSPINRLSIGIQSFAQSDLEYMNRAHNATEAVSCIKNAQDIGLTNISADLIYGSPTTTDETWIENIEKMIAFEIPHISAYALTIEEGTALHHFVNTGKVKPVEESVAANQFDILMDRLSIANFDHYEISNFAKKGHYAVHNSNYWLGVPYLGLGPAAHSFDGNNTRSWNLSHNPKYMTAIKENKLPIEHEKLSIEDAYNEFVLIRLRTIWGIDVKDLDTEFPEQKDHFLQNVQPYLDSKHIDIEKGVFRLTNSGKLFGDKISMELFVE